MIEQEFLEILYLFQKELKEQAFYGGSTPIEKISTFDGGVVYLASSSELRQAIKNVFSKSV